MNCLQGDKVMTLFGYEFTFGNSSIRSHKKPPNDMDFHFSLAEAKPGQQVRVRGFLPGLSTERAWHLQSYGVVPGSYLLVLQQSPVTIVQVEHLELALERGLAAFIQVDET
jgi:Fe2+ transport system protein FeoA